MCGTVVSVGYFLSAPWQPGNRVLANFYQTHMTGQLHEADLAQTLGSPLEGCLQRYRVFPTMGLVRAPEYLSDEEACCLPVAGIAAWMGINWMRPVGRPWGTRKEYKPTGWYAIDSSIMGEEGGGEERETTDKTIVLLGTGGVSMCGLQIANASGMRTIVTSSSDDKLARATLLGADHVINYRATPKWQDEVMRFTGGAGADFVLETVGKPGTLARTFGAVALGGQISCIGAMSDAEEQEGGDGDEEEEYEGFVTVPAQADEDQTFGSASVSGLAIARNVVLRGIKAGPRDRLQEMLRFYERHRIKPPVDRVFEFGEAKEAVRYLCESKHFGKVVVRVREKKA